MTQETLEIQDVHGVREVRQTALERVVVAVSMLEEDEARALLSMSDEELGHTLKSGIEHTAKVAREIRRDLHRKQFTQIRVAPKPAIDAIARRTHTADTAWDEVVNHGQALKARQALVRARKVLPAAAIWEGLAVTKQALSKAVHSGRIFNIDVGAETYYPAFYLSADIDRKQLAKVTQTLGSLPGWSKWQFFTTPSDFLDGVTPLVALSRGEVDDVRKLALAFIER